MPARVPIDAHDVFAFESSYANELDGFYVPWEGAVVPKPEIVQLNGDLIRELALDEEALASPLGAELLVGSQAVGGSVPLAQAYAGHQFGGFSPQLGDGRAILIGELIDRNGARRDIHLKGSGPTPFSRGGDGKAVLGPVLREYLIGEAMHALGIPTTRALAAVSTGERIIREGPEPGAVLVRVAASHIRIGTFQFFAARRETAKVRQLADYAIQRHYPELRDEEDPYLGLLRRVLVRQAELVARWLSVGFVHGVMNTDNVAISGETLDYGPCAFIDGYDPLAVFSSIDHQGRYAFGNQPAIAQWNLARLAETLLPLIDESDPENAVRLASAEVDAFPAIHEGYWLDLMRGKIGLTTPRDGDLELVRDLHGVMDGQEVDFTKLFRRLADAVRGNAAPARELFNDAAVLDPWLERWLVRLGLEDIQTGDQADAMDRVNPVYIPRNHKVEEALQAARTGDLAPFEKLLDVLTQPFERREDLAEYEEPAPEEFGRYRTYCGT